MLKWTVLIDGNNLPSEKELRDGNLYCVEQRELWWNNGLTRADLQTCRLAKRVYRLLSRVVLKDNEIHQIGSRTVSLKSTPTSSSRWSTRYLKLSYLELEESAITSTMAGWILLSVYNSAGHASTNYTIRKINPWFKFYKLLNLFRNTFAYFESSICLWFVMSTKI